MQHCHQAFPKGKVVSHDGFAQKVAAVPQGAWHLANVGCERSTWRLINREVYKIFSQNFSPEYRMSSWMTKRRSATNFSDGFASPEAVTRDQNVSWIFELPPLEKEQGAADQLIKP